MTTALINGALPAPKQIRFVHNQGQPPSKRRRINAACLTCRKRKTRCAGERPICTTCSKNGHTCLGYSEIIEKKGAASGILKGGDARPDDDDDEYMEDEYDEEEKRPWKAKSGPKSFTPINGEINGGGAPSVGANGGNGRRGSESEGPFGQGVRRRDERERDRPQLQTRGRRTVSYSEDTRSSNSRSPMRHHSESHRVPYFRYFGPTAIVPGFKQMVVSVRDRRRSTGGSFSATSPSGMLSQHHHQRILGPGIVSNVDVSNHILDGDLDISGELEEVPVYDPNDSAPVSPIILELVKTFFLNLGCNYPFLKEAKFIRMVKEKRVEPILVDAVCALAARFVELPPVIGVTGAHGNYTGAGNGNARSTSRIEYGHVFAQRAKSATVDTFPCPTVGAVQAFLLMAYEGFGENQDSALWMYLGLAIRMCVDLGLQKMVGVKYQGEKDPWYTRHWSRKSSDGAGGGSDDGHGMEDEDVEGSRHNSMGNDGRNGGIELRDGDKPDDEGCLSMEEQREVEQERIDTFWAVFVLDRVISSGTGRPVTFKDDDFELALPEPSVESLSGWPDPQPTFLQIIHLYGRVSDVLNNIRNAEDLTDDKWDKLVKMENELTKLYQKQDQRLHFNVHNFKAYLKADQGTTFILLHFWFHALIIILHQPTLLTPFGSLSRTHQLLPNSRELSMSSAKTIADILAFAELIDPKSFIGNPFTSQPMYIAACAFLMESVANASQPASREVTPPPETPRNKQHGQPSDKASLAKHSLLASAANQNYQRCYNSLQQLHSYWGGVKYILTALDQKSKGIWDCETYTHEEYESTKMPRRGSTTTTAISGRFRAFENPASPNVPPIAWSLTGTTNSPNSSLTLMYQNVNGGIAPSQVHSHATSQPHYHTHHSSQLHSHTHTHSHSNNTSGPISAATPPGNMIYDPIRQSLPDQSAMFPPAYPQQQISAIRNSPGPVRPSKPQRTNSISSASAPGVGASTPTSKSMLKYESLPDESNSGTTTPPSAIDQPPSKLHMLGTPISHQQQAQATYTPSSQHSSGYEPSVMPSASPASTLADPPSGSHHGSSNNGANGGYADNGFPHGLTSGLSAAGATYSYLGQGMGPITDVITFDSQEIDIGALGLRNEMMPSWFEYLPEDVLGLLESGTMGGGN